MRWWLECAREVLFRNFEEASCSTYRSVEEVWFQCLWAWDSLRVRNQSVFHCQGSESLSHSSCDYPAIIFYPPSLTSGGIYRHHHREDTIDFWRYPTPPPRRHQTEENEDVLEDEIISIAVIPSLLAWMTCQIALGYGPRRWCSSTWICLTVTTFPIH